MTFTLKEDLQLFNNDLEQYKASEQGQNVMQATTDKEKAAALAEYWNARNANKLTYKSEQDRINGATLDKMLAEYLKMVD